METKNSLECSQKLPMNSVLCKINPVRVLLHISIVLSSRRHPGLPKLSVPLRCANQHALEPLRLGLA
jgi:hypothetical protein